MILRHAGNFSTHLTVTGGWDMEMAVTLSTAWSTDWAIFPVSSSLSRLNGVDSLFSALPNRRYGVVPGGLEQLSGDLEIPCVEMVPAEYDRCLPSSGRGGVPFHE